jgi:hypothetical protein
VVYFLEIVTLIDGPSDDRQVLLAIPQEVDDRLDQIRVEELPAQERKVVRIELDPVTRSFEVLKPTVTAEPVPVVAYPLVDGLFAQITPRDLADDPLVPKGFFEASMV